jgi:hypothetical protein
MRRKASRFELSVWSFGPFLWACGLLPIAFAVTSDGWVVAAIWIAVLALSTISSIRFVVTSKCSWIERRLLGVAYRKTQCGVCPSVVHSGWSWDGTTIDGHDPAIGYPYEHGGARQLLNH